MAESIAALYLRLGLDISELQSDFVAAEQSVQQNLARLSREHSLINIRMQIDTAALDAVKDKDKILEVQTRAISERLKLQQDRLKWVTAEYQAAATAKGKNVAATQKLEIVMERERLKVIQLEQELKKLSSQRVTPPSSLTEHYNDIKGNVGNSLSSLTGKFNELSAATASTDAAIQKSLEYLEKIPSPVGKAVAALAALPVVLIAVEKALVNMASPAIAAGDSFYVMSRGLQMSIADTAKFVTNCKVAGVEVNDLAQSMKRLLSEFVKSGKDSNATTKMLEKYGANLRDDAGNLKNVHDATFELNKALKNAQAAGAGLEFTRTVLKRFSADAITTIEDWADVNDQASGLIKNGLANPAFAHAVQGNLNALNVQIAQTKGTLGSILMPAANESILELTNLFGKLTLAIKENKENIVFLGNVVKAPIKLFNELADGVLNISNALDKFKESGSSVGKTLDYFAQKRQNLSDLLEVSPLAGLAEMTNILPEVISFYDVYADKIAQLREERQKSAADLNSTAKQEAEAAKNEIAELAALHGLDAKRFADFEALEKAIASSEERILKNERETADKIYHLHHTAYENRLYDVNRFIEESFNKENVTEDEKFSIVELAMAKRLEIEREKEDRIAAIREKANAQFQTDLDNRIDAIESASEEWVKAGMSAAEAETLAERQKLDAIQQLENSFAQSVESIHQTALENRLAQIEAEKKAWIQKGIDEVEATKAAEEAKNKARQNAALQMLKSQLEEYRAYQEGGYTGLLDYQRGKLIDSGIDPRELNITPEQLEDFQRAQDVAQRNLLPNLASAEDRQAQTELVNADIAEYRQAFQRMLEGITINGEHPQLSYEEFSGLTAQVQTAESNFEKLNEALQDIPTMQANTTDIPPNDSEIAIPAESQLDEITPHLSEVASGLENLGESLQNFTIPAQSQNIDAAQGNSSNNINVTVEIAEAHAWDSERIQELADKVADHVTPAITSAIGGDSNSY